MESESKKFERDFISLRPDIIESIASSEDGSKEKQTRENIESIRATIRSGKHDTLYYPAAGRDILRPLVAYNVTRLIAVDLDETELSFIKRQLNDLQIPYKERALNQGGAEIEFNYDGKDRVIELQVRDIRGLTPRDFGLNTFDVLHIYDPTGGDLPVTTLDKYIEEKFQNQRVSAEELQKALKEDTEAPKPNMDGEYEPVYKGVQLAFNKENASMVSIDGFLCLNERLPMYAAPNFFEVLGWKQIPITVRDTGLSIGGLSNKSTDMGFIYQKKREMSDPDFELYLEVNSTFAMLLRWLKKDQVAESEIIEYVEYRFHDALELMKQRGVDMTVIDHCKEEFGKMVSETQDFLSKRKHQ